MKLQYFIVAMLCPLLSMCQSINIRGKVVNEQGEAVANATVRVMSQESSIVNGSLAGARDDKQILRQAQHDRISTTNERGEFATGTLNLAKGDTLIISATGYDSETVAISTIPFPERAFTITLKRKITLLDEAMVIAYGTTTRRLNTGSVGKISAEEINRQPVANPLAALQGRVPGLLVTQTSGMPGAAVRLLIRGQNSFTQGSEPFYIIDGVPFAPGNTDLNQFSSALASNATQGLSPFNSINPADIESIEILKDADATAIYGSRGANGVILITTKRGKSGKVKLNASVRNGSSYVTKMMRMLNTQEYLQMRREAFANDGATPTVTNAPDLLAWDTTRYTNLQDLLLKGSAGMTEAYLSAGGGTNTTGFTLSGTYRKETSVFPGDMYDSRISAHLNFYNQSPDRKYSLQLSASYSSDNNNLVMPDISSAYRLPPNIPSFYSADGKLNWQGGGVSFENPMAYLLQSYTAVTDNFLSNLQVSYRVLPGLIIKASAGYNRIQTEEEGITPIASLNPFASIAPTGSSRFGDVFFKSWIAEPQAEYRFKYRRNKITILIGATWQETIGESSRIIATGYTSDALLHSVSGATAISADNSYNQYRYEAVFCRIQVNRNDKWLLNLSGRRDGSSRFGPGKQFSNFGAAGAGWIFSKEKFIAKKLSFISYGKLRASYGITGNDQIGNYQYTDSWRNTSNPYQGIPGLVPSRLFNPDYSWEVNRKGEAALELGFLKDRLWLSVAYFRNRSSNQLVKYTLPTQTGFGSITKNLPALVQNTGWEIEAKSRNIQRKTFNWVTHFNITIHRNKLIEFPGLAQSSYSSTYIIGEPLNVIYAYHLTGVNPATGVYQFEDVNGDNLINNSDRAARGSRDPQFYGGIGNDLNYKGWSLNIFFEFRKQNGRNYLASLLNNPPGRMVNQPAIVLNRWRKAGDAVPVQGFTASTSSNIYKAWATLGQSDGIYSDASYARLKNVMISYETALKRKGKTIAEIIRVYVQAQNLLTITGYEGSDPETQSLLTLPPLRTMTAGIQLTF